MTYGIFRLIFPLKTNELIVPQSMVKAWWKHGHNASSSIPGIWRNQPKSTSFSISKWAFQIGYQYLTYWIWVPIFMQSAFQNTALFANWVPIPNIFRNCHCDGGRGSINRSFPLTLQLKLSLPFYVEMIKHHVGVLQKISARYFWVIMIINQIDVHRSK